MERVSYGVERGTDLTRAEQVVRPVQAARARTPEVATTCDPGEEREALYRDFERTMVRPINEWPVPLPRAPHMCTQKEEAVLGRC